MSASSVRKGRTAGAWIASLAVALPLMLPTRVGAQYEEPPPPAAYALENVTVIRADGSRLDGVSLVVRDGLIEVLGAGATIPADAEVLEGDSLFVYPGLVDAEGDADVEWPDATDEDDGDDVTSWDPPRSRQGFTPHRRVSHNLVDTGADLDDPREAGVVAALVHPGGGMAPGQPAALVFRKDADTPWELVDVETAGLTMSFQTASGVYPSQLFGVIAYLRQAFMDAARYETLRSTYREAPSGMTAPAWDPDYEALRRAARGEAPVFFRADSDEDIRRALGLADQFGFRLVLLGGDEAWKVADELARRGVPVLASLDFPEPDEWDPEADTVEAELEPGALREKERLEGVWANPARLVEAGVTVALTSGGGDADLLEGARKAVEYGLSEEAALRALTSTPAELLGLPALSRVEEGMAATFLVADGELFDDDTEVAYTFVEGDLQRGATVSEEPAAGGEEPAGDLTGEWEAELSGDPGSFELTLMLEQADDGTLEGTARSDQAQGEPAEISGFISGRRVTLELHNPQMPEPIEIEAELSEDGLSLSGSASMPFGDFDFEAERSSGGPGALSWRDLFDGRAHSLTGGGR